MYSSCDSSYVYHDLGLFLTLYLIWQMFYALCVTFYNFLLTYFALCTRKFLTSFIVVCLNTADGEIFARDKFLWVVEP